RDGDRWLLARNSCGFILRQLHDKIVRKRIDSISVHFVKSIEGQEVLVFVPTTCQFQGLRKLGAQIITVGVIPMNIYSRGTFVDQPIVGIEQDDLPKSRSWIKVCQTRCFERHSIG